MPKPAEPAPLRETPAEAKPFSEHLASRIEESSPKRADRTERNEAKSSGFRDAEENSNKEETNRPEKKSRREDNALHHLAGAVHLHALKISREAKTKPAKEPSVHAESASADQLRKKKAQIPAEFAQIEQGIASILTALAAHKTAKPGAEKAVQAESGSSRQTKELLQKTAQLRRQLGAVEQHPASLPEEKAAAKRADSFLAKLEQMVKKNSPKDIKKEHLTALTDDIRKELTVIRQTAEKIAKPRVQTDAAAAAAVRSDSPKQEISESTPSAAKETGVSVQSVHQSSASKNDTDAQSGFGFMKQMNASRESMSAGRDQTAQIKGTPFAEHVDEIISKSKMTIRDGKNGSLSFRLNPDNLGSVSVNLGLENGVLSAKFLVDSPEAKESLSANMNALKETLQQEGIQLGQFQVDVRAGYSGQSRDHEEYAAPAMKGSLSEAEKATHEYDAASIPVHDGAIDITI